MTNGKYKLHLPYGRQFMDEADIEAVTKALKDPFITTGPKALAFEEELCRLTGAKYAVVCANGTAALHLACLALGVGPGDLGLTSPLSFLASANCIEYCRGNTDFVDIDLSTLCISVEKLEARCRKEPVPKLVIPVDFAGIPSDLPAIRKLGERYGFSIIEDAAHALGSEYRVGAEKYACGSCMHTDLAIFSFHPVKTITTGEGGAVMTNSEELASKLRRFRNHGADRSDAMLELNGEWYYEMDRLGYNFRITDIQCALGLSQLKKLAWFKSRRSAIVSFYNEAFRNVDNMILPPKALEDQACPHLYPVQFVCTPEIRRKLYVTLREFGLFCQVHYIPIYWQPYYREKYGFRKGKCPEAEAYYSRCLSLPLFPGMSQGDAGMVVEAVHKAMSLHGL